MPTSTRSLLVRGTAGQVAQIRDLLRQMGETTKKAAASVASQQHVRLLPLTGAAARSAISRSSRSGRAFAPIAFASLPQRRRSALPPQRIARDQWRLRAAHSLPQPYRRFDRGSCNWHDLSSMLRRPAAPALALNSGKIARSTGADQLAQSIFRFAAENASRTAAQCRPDSRRCDQPPSRPQPTASKPPDGSPATATRPAEAAPILIAPGPGGTLIASDDFEALDELEDMLTYVAGRSATSGREYCRLLSEVLQGGDDRRSAGRDLRRLHRRQRQGHHRRHGQQRARATSAADSWATCCSAAVAAAAVFTSASVDIVPDARLNALIVHAKPADLDTIEQLLQVLDQRTGPEDVEADGQPRPIPVYNTTASGHCRRSSSSSTKTAWPAAARMMSPQDMMKMIRGGNNTEQQVQKMSVAVDIANNMLIVVRPRSAIRRNQSACRRTGPGRTDSPETTRVVSLKHTNSAAVQKALTSILDNVQTNTTAAQTTATTPSIAAATTMTTTRRKNVPRPAMRRNWEMMQEMRRMQERMGGGDRGGGVIAAASSAAGRTRGRGGDSGRGGSDGFRGRGSDSGRNSDATEAAATAIAAEAATRNSPSPHGRGLG